MTFLSGDQIGSRPRSIRWSPGISTPQALWAAFLSGFKLSVIKSICRRFEEAKQIMAAAIQQDVREDIGGDEQRISNIATSYSAVTFKHILLPVYIGAYRFNQKVPDHGKRSHR
jgi:hypothetical protein